MLKSISSINELIYLWFNPDSHTGTGQKFKIWVTISSNEFRSTLSKTQSKMRNQSRKKF